MTTFTHLTDPLIMRVVAHVYAKHSADIVGTDGKHIANKAKYSATSEQLLRQYGLNITRQTLKAKKVRRTTHVCCCLLRCALC